MRKARKAYTLIELVLVCAILVVVAGMSFHFMGVLSGPDGLTGKQGQIAALDVLRGRLADARERAEREGKPYRVAVVRGKGNYRVAPDDESFWSGSAGDSQKGSVIAGALPHGSCFCPADGSADAGGGTEGQTSSEPSQVAPGSYETLVIFTPKGVAKDDGQIGLKTVGAKRMIVKIQGDTGVVTAQEG